MSEMKRIVQTTFHTGVVGVVGWLVWKADGHLLEKKSNVKKLDQPGW